MAEQPVRGSDRPRTPAPAQASERGYHHQPPRRPPRLPRRLEPPPERQTVDIRWMVYIGIALAAIFLILMIPYAIAYIVEFLTA